jgi:pilus assembly protein Flp/PilA
MRRKSEMARLVGTFLVEEDGPTGVEYAVMLSLIIIASIGAIATLGTKMIGVFEWEYAQLPDG